MVLSQLTSLTQLPYKSSLFSLLTALVNVSNYDMASEMVLAVSTLLNTGLQQSAFRQIKLSVRFFATSLAANLILPAQFILLVDSFMAVCGEEGVATERADAFVYIVMTSIPYSCTLLKDRYMGELERIYTDLQGYMDQRICITRHESTDSRLANVADAKMNAEVHVADEKMDEIYGVPQNESVAQKINLAHETLSVYKSHTTPYLMQDALQVLWAQLLNLRKCGFVINVLPDIPSSLIGVLERQIHLDVPLVHIPSSLTEVKFLYQPKFWVFDDSVNAFGNHLSTLNIDDSIIVKDKENHVEIEENQPDDVLIAQDHMVDGKADDTTKDRAKPMSHLPCCSDPARFIIDDNITDTIRIFALNHKECTTQLLNISTYFNTTFIEGERYQVNEAIIESIFCEMFRLPKSHEKFVYYTTLIMDLCKASLDSIPSILGRSIKILFSRIDGMDVELIKRFTDFFAIHLSNFAYSWKWGDWEYVLAQPTSSMQYIFIRETLQKCVRLAYYDRIKNSIPESYEVHGNIFPANAPSHQFGYKDVESIGDERLGGMIEGLSSSIATRADVAIVEGQLSAIQEFLEANRDIMSKITGFNTDIDDDDAHALTHDFFFQSVLFQGSKSFSHLLNVIEKYLTVLQSYNTTLQSRIATANITAKFWSNNSQFLEIIIGKLINYRILDSESVISWLLSTKTLEFIYDRFYIWSILSGTLYKMELKQSQIMQKIALLKGSEVTDSEMTDPVTDDLQLLESALEASKLEKKDIFILTFKKFIDILTLKINADPDCEGTGFWVWVTGFMRQTAREFKRDIHSFKVTLDAIVFDQGVDSRILKVWSGVKAVYELHAEDYE